MEIRDLEERQRGTVFIDREGLIINNWVGFGHFVLSVLFLFTWFFFMLFQRSTPNQWRVGYFNIGNIVDLA